MTKRKLVSPSIKSSAIFALFITFASTITSSACGPYYPYAILKDQDAYKRLPALVFEQEIKKIPFETRFEKPLTTTAKLSLEEELALAMRTYKTPNSAEVLTAYTSFRQKLNEQRALYNDHIKYRTWSYGSDYHYKASKLPTGLPQEYLLYLEGAQLYYQEKYAKAINKWQALLQLPAEKRKFRTTWAHFMIGRTLQDHIAPKFSLEQFRQTREKAQKGFADNAQLAHASLGWQARSFYLLKDYKSAMHLYIKDYQSGSENALTSMLLVCQKVFKAETQNDILTKLAQDPDCARIISAFLLSRHIDYSSQNAQKLQTWCRVLQEKSAIPDHYSDRIAWIAYKVNNLKMAQQYMQKAPRSAVKIWLESRFFLRAGQKDKALAKLQELSQFIQQQKNDIYIENAYFDYDRKSLAEFALAEQSLLRLEKAQFEMAIILLLKAGFFMDADYLAERILTLEECKVLTARLKKDPNTEEQVCHNISNLVARRLSRLGFWREARTYYTDQSNIDLHIQYIEAIRRGHDKKRTSSERATDFWQAAIIARENGMQLLGTELYPDNAYNWVGDFASWRLKADADGKITMHEKEKLRLKQNSHPKKRWHYRHVAADHAWSALQLMPDNSEEKARRCIIAGRWISAKYPKDADRFYKYLVKSCGATELGKIADKKRWFPSLEKYDKKHQSL